MYSILWYIKSSIYIKIKRESGISPSSLSLYWRVLCLLKGVNVSINL